MDRSLDRPATLADTAGATPPRGARPQSGGGPSRPQPGGGPSRPPRVPATRRAWPALTAEDLTAEDLAAAAGRTLPDVIAPGLTVLFCGINPGLLSAAVGRHFARPGNRFWPALHRSGFTATQLHPEQQDELVALGLGVTNVAARATARADELTAAELVAGGRTLRRKVARYRPRWVAVLGIGAYRTAFGAPDAVIGEQPVRLAGARVWVLPNPSGLNAHYPLPRLSAEFAALREATGR
jgi:TDG/mug DNA glycosylase family protein